MDVELEPHRWNQGFTWRPADTPPRRVSRAQREQFDREGYFLYPDAFDAATLERVVAEIDPLEVRAEAFLRTRPDQTLGIARADAITFTIHLVKQSPWLRDFCAGPVFRDLAHDLIGPDVRLYWDQAVYKKPEIPQEFPWHQDNGYTYVEPQQYLTCWVALTDATVEAGCPWVVPGLHLRGTLRHRTTSLGFACLEDPKGAVPVEVAAGGIAVFSSLTPHRTGPNRTERPRKAYIVQFAPEGAHALLPDDSGRVNRVAQDDPDRQFPILVAGKPPPTR